MGSATEDQRATDSGDLSEEVSAVERELDEHLDRLRETREGRSCYPFLGVEIKPPVVDDIFDDLRSEYADCSGRLDVIVDSGGGDIDAAYNLSMLFRRYGGEELNFIVPRWAKSAATLLVCSGDSILMSPVAELGPLDPQITEYNPLEGRLERFSPLHIELALDLIRHEFEEGNEKLAKGLMERLQFPLTLGGFRKYHEIGEQYVAKLLNSRMLSGDRAAQRASEIARRLARGYASHGFCINIDEAESIGLNAIELDGHELDYVWSVHRLSQKKRELEKQMRTQKIMDKIKELPSELLEGLPPDLVAKLPESLREDLAKGGSGELGKEQIP